MTKEEKAALKAQLEAEEKAEKARVQNERDTALVDYTVANLTL